MTLKELLPSGYANPYESLRQRGLLPATDGDVCTETIFTYGPYMAVIILQEPMSGRWVYGYNLSWPGMRGEQTLRESPMEGTGWFLSRDDALTYALYELRLWERYTGTFGAGLMNAIDRRLSDLRNPSIF